MKLSDPEPFKGSASAVRASESLQIQNVGVGEALVVDVARRERLAIDAVGGRGAGDVHALRGGFVARQAFAIRADDASGPFADDALGDRGQRLLGAASDERDDGALMRSVAGAALKRVAELLAELAIGAQRRVDFAINFADDSRARGRWNVFGQEMLDLRLNRADDLLHRSGVGGMEESDFRGALRIDERLRGIYRRDVSCGNLRRRGGWCGSG